MRMTFIKETTCSIGQRMCFSSCIFGSKASYETESGLVVEDGELNKKLKWWKTSNVFITIYKKKFRPSLQVTYFLCEFRL